MESTTALQNQDRTEYAMTCPHCGLSIVATTRATASKALCLNADTSAMSETAMRAYYKRIAHAADAAFFAHAIRNCGDRRLILSAETLALQAAAGSIDRTTTNTQLRRLQGLWRALDYRPRVSVETVAA